MLKNIVKLEYVIQDKAYQFLCDNDAPIEHIKEALFQCQTYIGQVEQNVKAQLAQKETEENKIEELITPEA